MELLSIPASFIEWVGLESTAASAITQGFGATPGLHILWLDYLHTVDVQVDSVGPSNAIRIHNGNPNQMSGLLELTK